MIQLRPNELITGLIIEIAYYSRADGTKYIRYSSVLNSRGGHDRQELTLCSPFVVSIKNNRHIVDDPRFIDFVDKFTGTVVYKDSTDEIFMDFASEEDIVMFKFKMTGQC
jgi:hypothetical protein